MTMPAMSRKHNLIRPDVSGLTDSSSSLYKGGKRGIAAIGGLKTKTVKRHRKIMRDNIQGITRPDIRRLARRGGVKRISVHVYDEVRGVLRDYLTTILSDIAAVVENCGRKTIVVTDVVFALRCRGQSLYGFGTGNTRGRGGD